MFMGSEGNKFLCRSLFLGSQRKTLAVQYVVHSQQVTALIRLQTSYRAYILFLLQKNNRKAGLVHFMHFGRPYSISCGLLLSLCVCLSVGHDRKPFKKRMNRSSCRFGCGLGGPRNLVLSGGSYLDHTQTCLQSKLLKLIR